MPCIAWNYDYSYAKLQNELLTKWQMEKQTQNWSKDKWKTYHHTTSKRKHRFKASWFPYVGVGNDPLVMSWKTQESKEKLINVTSWKYKQ